MTIEIHEPELEELIRERMETGRFRNVEDVLMHALKSSVEDAEVENQTSLEPKKNIVDFLLESPLRGSGLVIERIEEYPTPIDL